MSKHLVNVLRALGLMTTLGLGLGFVAPHYAAEKPPVLSHSAVATQVQGPTFAPVIGVSGVCSTATYAAMVATAAAGLLARAKRSKIVTRAGGPESGMSVTMEEVKSAQSAWAEAIKKISKIYLSGGDYVAAAAQAAGELYGYGHGKVLFKPTKASDVQFRPEASQAMSYFVGADAVEGGIAEDHGFAINGGKGWSDVLFDNHQIDLNGNVAIAMGNYFFASTADGSISKVEYTFGYRKCADGKVRICLHHSSLPYPGSTTSTFPETATAAVTSAPAEMNFAAATPVAAAFVGSSVPQAQGVEPLRHSIGFAYSAQKDAHVDLEFGNDVGYLPDGTPMNMAGNNINHPENIGPDPHAPGSPLPRAVFVNDVGYLPDGTPMNQAGNAINHPEAIGPDPHSPGSALPQSAYAADVGYLVDGTPLDSAGNNAIH